MITCFHRIIFFLESYDGSAFFLYILEWLIFIIILKIESWILKTIWNTEMSTPQFNTSVPHKDHSFSVPKILQFNTKNLSVQHQNPLSSTPKTSQFHTPLSPFSVLNWRVLSVELKIVFNWGLCWTEGFSVWNWEVCGTECFWCNWGDGTEGQKSHGIQVPLPIPGFESWKGVAFLNSNIIFGTSGPDLCFQS